MPPSARSLRCMFLLPQCEHVIGFWFAIELPSQESIRAARKGFDAPLWRRRRAIQLPCKPAESDFSCAIGHSRLVRLCVDRKHAPKDLNTLVGACDTRAAN